MLDAAMDHPIEVGSYGRSRLVQNEKYELGVALHGDTFEFLEPKHILRVKVGVELKWVFSVGHNYAGTVELSGGCPSYTQGR